MPFVVVYDACVLHPAPLRDLLVRLDVKGLVQARWSDDILDECFESILKARPDLKPEALARTRELMNRAVPNALTKGYEKLIAALNLPDADDRHVLAAAIRASAQVIVTFNLQDFPAAELEGYGLEAKHPDDFVLDTLFLAPGLVAATVVEQANGLKNPPRAVDELLGTLRDLGLPQSVTKLRELLARGQSVQDF